MKLKLIDEEKYWDSKTRLKYLEEMKEDCVMFIYEGEQTVFFIKSKDLVIIENFHYMSGVWHTIETWDEYINELKRCIKEEEDDKDD